MRIYKHLQIPPDETKDSSVYFPWERLRRDRDETTFQPNKVSTVKNGSRQYINVTQRALSTQRGRYGVAGTPERLLHKDAGT